ncbi:UDP-3-O-(3-hydroxymyristoyl)glucosamine N-acyltransferase [Sphingobacteriales bacterium UPWRP_1]|nr:UDP-3-O-(3-hydroxymyristoyl)glucosamine N-acyltransferase [Sphingobacteriales bacterium TSM_CSS]PSJ76037.1 UDP-3-O-(3-hydroxymyristoyl)glucosamine N-acyltransferase [Sphingobacteriales bacterium UPWRP_1]
MQISVQQLAALLNAEIEGNPQVMVQNLAKIEDAQNGDLSFIANPRYLPYAYTTRASVLVVNKDFIPEKPVAATLLKVDDAYRSFAQLLEFYNQMNRPKGIEQPCFIHPTAVIGNGVYIGAFAYVGENAVLGNNVLVYPQTFIGKGVQVGENTVLYAGVKVYEGCTIGNNCMVHSGAVIGSDGFGFAPQPDGSYRKIPQTGIVTIADNVEIGANTCIDRATIGATTILEGVKIDNLVQIAHNVRIDQSTVIAAQAGISGSTKIGRYCMIGGQAGFTGHLTIAGNTKVNAQSGVTKSVEEENRFLSGSPAFDYRNQMRAYVLFKQLPDFENRLKALENQLRSEER